MWGVESLTLGGAGEQIKEGLCWEDTFEMGIEEWVAFGWAKAKENVENGLVLFLEWWQAGQG